MAARAKPVTTLALTTLTLCLGSGVVSNAAAAHESGEITARVGSHYIVPDSDNGDVVDVKSAFGLTGGLQYFIRPSLAVDLLLAVPYKHDIALKGGGGEVASTRHLPPTLSLVWYPQLGETLKPFVGAGLNYTLFFDEKTRGALAGTHLSLDDSFGLAFVAGLEVALDPRWSIVADVRYLDIDSKARVDGASIGTVTIDPVGYGLALAYRF